MGKKLNKNLLSEELKKFRLLSEYSFYVEEPKKDEEKLLLGSDLEEADENPEDANTTSPSDDSNTAQNDAPAPDAGGASDPNAAPTTDQNTPPAPAPVPDPSAMPDSSAPDGIGMEDTDDEVDVDVTELVQGSEEATDAANSANMKTSKLLKKFADLERRVAQMDDLSQKIDGLGKEIARRNPTPVEKLEMRSMDSFPYNIKLSDYFKETESSTSPDGVKKVPEYILKKGDIDTKFVDSSIKNSFDIPDDYEEEDVF